MKHLGGEILTGTLTGLSIINGIITINYYLENKSIWPAAILTSIFAAAATTCYLDFKKNLKDYELQQNKKNLEEVMSNYFERKD